MTTNKRIKLFGAFATATVAMASSFFVCNAYTKTNNYVIELQTVDSASYFADIEAHISTYTRQGLYEALHDRINDGWKRISYQSLPNHIVNVDFDENGYLNDIYSSEHQLKKGDSGTGNFEGDKWNKEHFIPKSWWGGDKDGPSGEGGDMFNMYATDAYVNCMRSNYPLGEVSSIERVSEGSFSKLGTSSSDQLKGHTVFEINDKFKPLAAHSYFYFACKYDVMNCPAGKYTQGDGGTTFAKNGTFGLTSYASNLFLKWNKDKSNIQFEKDRAEKVYAEQNNLNPFIYHPEWADFIWGCTPLTL